MVVAVAGLAILLMPAGVLSLAGHSVSPPQLYASGILRIAIGVLFISVAGDARVPWLLRVLGGVALVAGIGALFLGVQPARAIADWLSQQSLDVVRLLGLLPLALGILVIYACGSTRRAV